MKGSGRSSARLGAGWSATKLGGRGRPCDIGFGDSIMVCCLKPEPAHFSINELTPLCKPGNPKPRTETLNSTEKGRAASSPGSAGACASCEDAGFKVRFRV